MPTKRRAAIAIAAGVAALVAVATQSAATRPVWSVSGSTVAGVGVADIYAVRVGSSSTVIVESRDGRRSTVHVLEGQVTFVAAGDRTLPGPPERPGMLPDGEVATGAGLIAEAYLTGPTERYRHGILGDMIEASGIRVTTSDGAVLDATLGPESVFEDRLARIADIDGDGADDVIVVRSYLDRGAALSAWSVRGGELVRIAEAPAIGRPSRWLNPIGVADFDADGTPEVAAVITPHIGGILKFYSVRGEALIEEGSERGFSNHFIGSRALGLSAVFDADGDGIPDIALPDAGRRAIRIMTFAGGAIGELANLALPSRVRTSFVRVAGAEPVFLFGLEDGSLAVLRRR